MSQKCHSILLDSRGRARADMAGGSWDFEHGHIIPEHSHPEHQLVFASAGVMTVSTRDGVWVVPPLRAVWIPARTPHRIAMFGAVSMRTLYFLPRPGREKCAVFNVSPLLRELILHACRYKRLSRKVPIERRIIDLILDQLEAVPAIPLRLPQPADPRALRVATALLANPADERTLIHLCRDCGASKRTVERLFVVETKMTFGRWRQQLRLLHSMKLLAQGEKVNSAALEAGYQSTSAFISMFRRQVGTTPTRYFSAGRRSGRMAQTDRPAPVSEQPLPGSLKTVVGNKSTTSSRPTNL